MCDDLTANYSGVDARINSVSSQTHSIQEKQNELQKNKTKSYLIRSDVACERIFSGLPGSERYNENGEDCESLVKDFIKSELHIDDEIPLDRAHRLGRYNARHQHPRPVVEKFTFHKDKERIRKITG